ncbi:1478_t:CDS:2 [Acaulospora morrowiae]|uniref:1478_t:CDS:1 n=1 Tax=Acaulospora morrowiae TaxID=94023 RepID=A0A9N8VFY5_9GLOM|nr:1478_t:CDS:2 [Acaulospora morrowiae]
MVLNLKINAKKFQDKISTRCKRSAFNLLNHLLNSRQYIFWNFASL